MLLPVLLLLCMGAVDFGRGLNAWVVMQNAAREGAFYAASNPSASASTVTSVVLIEAAPFLSGQGVSVSNLSVTGPFKIDGVEERSDQVIVTYRFPLITPILFGGSITMVAEAAAPEGP